jgi:hypothetical protein
MEEESGLTNHKARRQQRDAQHDVPAADMQVDRQ